MSYIKEILHRNFSTVVKIIRNFCGDKLPNLTVLARQQSKPVHFIKL